MLLKLEEPRNEPRRPKEALDVYWNRLNSQFIF